MKEIDLKEYPIIQEWIDKGCGDYIEKLKQSVSRQLESRRYYKMKYRGAFEPYITEQDVLAEIELFLQVAPIIFKIDVCLLAESENKTC